MTTYTYEEALEASTEYFGNDLSARAFVDKYALRNKNNEFVELTPKDTHDRIAKELARIEKNKFKNPLSKKEIFDLLDKFKSIIPQGSPLYGIGNKYQYVSTSNCFVVDNPYDSYGGICRTDSELVQISKRRGGVGVDLSSLRPTDARTNNSSRSSTGTASWMERYSNTIREVGQCLRFDQRVLTKNGLKQIQYVVPNKDYVWTKEGWIKVVNKYANGRKKLFKLTTQGGYSVVASENHVFQTFNSDGELEERHLFELEAGEGIVLCIGNNSYSPDYVELDDPKHINSNNKPSNCDLPSILDEQLAYILGYSYGDGSIKCKLNDVVGLEFACSNDYESIKVKLEDYCSNVFSYDVTRRDGDGDLERLSIDNKTVTKFLEHNEILKEKSADIIFPQKIIDSPQSVQQAFISGYFDANGYASGKKKGYCFSSINKMFLEEIQLLLSTYGIASKIHFEDKSKQGWNTLYTLVVVGKVCQERFVNLFSLSIKTQKSQHISKRSCWLTPFKRQSFGITGKPFNYIPDSSQFMSLGCVAKLKKENIDVNTNLLQDIIYSIEAVEEHATFDIELESEHMFWCEGLYVHNSGRRGALMETISVHHPDIIKFATIKNDDKSVTGANISVRLSDEFLTALKDDEEYELRWPVDSNTPEFTEMVSAKKVWEEIIHSAWFRAEPGLLFWDNIIRESPADCYPDFKSVSTNPCGEIPLCANDSCRLLAINLYHFVTENYTADATFNFDAFYDMVIIAQRLMDDIVDLEIEAIDRIIKKINKDPEPEFIKRDELELWQKIKDKAVEGRRTGLGITALGDAMAAVNIKYGSDESVEFVEKIYKTLKLGAYRSSVDMAKELGAFPVWNPALEKDNPFLLRIKDEDLELYKDMQKYGRRNIAILTTAPTGTVSMMAYLDEQLHGTTSGIEPMIMAEYLRRKKGNPGDNDFRTDFIDELGDHWMEFEVYHPGIAMWMKTNDKTTIRGNPYVAADKINWTNRIKLQATAQRHVDHSISSTINLPNDISERQVAKIYLEAWENNLKGVTVYRDGCRSGVMVSKESLGDGIITHDAPKRPEELDCDVYHISVKGQAYFVLVGLLKGKPYEIFAGKNGFIDKKVKKGKIIKQKRRRYKAIFDDGTELSPIGAFTSDEQDTLTRLISAALRHGTDVSFLVHQLEKAQGDLQSFSKSMMRALKKYIPDHTEVKGEECPECTGKLMRSEGCIKCMNCGHSRC